MMPYRDRAGPTRYATGGDGSCRVVWLGSPMLPRLVTRVLPASLTLGRPPALTPAAGPASPVLGPAHPPSAPRRRSARQRGARLLASLRGRVPLSPWSGHPVRCGCSGTCCLIRALTLRLLDHSDFEWLRITDKTYAGSVASSACYNADQAWYWTPEWQVKEQQADQDIAEGRTQMFDSDEAFLAALHTGLEGE
jgi:hypothetical protein